MAPRFRISYTSRLLTGERQEAYDYSTAQMQFVCRVICLGIFKKKTTAVAKNKIRKKAITNDKFILAEQNKVLQPINKTIFKTILKLEKKMNIQFYVFSETIFLKHDI